MFVDRFQKEFAGEDTLSLLRCMAVANGNASLDGTAISELEAKRCIIDYQSPAHTHFADWSGLAREIHYLLEEAGPNPTKLQYEVFHLHLPLKDTAAYFRSKPAASPNQKAINAFFRCITSSIGRANRLLEGIGYGDKIHLGDYNHKWNKPSFHAVARTGLAPSSSAPYPAASP